MVIRNILLCNQSLVRPLLASCARRTFCVTMTPSFVNDSTKGLLPVWDDFFPNLEAVLCSMVFFDIVVFSQIKRRWSRLYRKILCLAFRHLFSLEALQLLQGKHDKTHPHHFDEHTMTED